MLDAGPGQTLSVIFTPDDTTDYTDATGTAGINVAPATSSFSSLDAPTITYGDASDTVSGQIFLQRRQRRRPHGERGDHARRRDPGRHDPGRRRLFLGFHDFRAQRGTYTVSFNYAATTDFIAANGTADLTVEKADATITVTPYAVTYDGNPHTATGTAVGVKGESLSGLNLNGTTHTGAGDYAATPGPLPTAPAIITTPAARLSDSIAKATPLTTLSDPSNPSAFGQPVTFTATVEPIRPARTRPTEARPSKTTERRSPATAWLPW